MPEWNPYESDIEGAARLDRVMCDGAEIKVGDRVIVRPQGRADIFDIALDGKIATVIAIEQDYENRVHLAVTIDDDPGADIGRAGQIGHRFFFGIDEVEPPGAEQQQDQV